MQHAGRNHPVGERRRNLRESGLQPLATIAGREQDRRIVGPGRQPPAGRSAAARTTARRPRNSPAHRRPRGRPARRSSRRPPRSAAARRSPAGPADRAVPHPTTRRDQWPPARPSRQRVAGRLSRPVSPLDLTRTYVRLCRTGDAPVNRESPTITDNSCIGRYALTALRSKPPVTPGPAISAARSLKSTWSPST